MMWPMPLMQYSTASSRSLDSESVTWGAHGCNLNQPYMRLLHAVYGFCMVKKGLLSL